MVFDCLSQEWVSEGGGFRAELGQKAATSNSSRDFSDAILPAERVGGPTPAAGVIVPLAVHDEAVFVRTRVQGHCRPPNAVLLSLQIDGVILPGGEVTHQLHRARQRGDELERFLKLQLYFSHGIPFLV